MSRERRLWMRALVSEAVSLVRHAAREGRQVQIPRGYEHDPIALTAWVDAHERAAGFMTDTRDLNPTRAPGQGERAVLFFDDIGQVVHGQLLEVFTDAVEEDGTGLTTYRITGDDGQTWESPYAACEQDVTR